MENAAIAGLIVIAVVALLVIWLSVYLVGKRRKRT